VANFTLNETPREFIPHIIDLTYIHNTGGAWGVLSGNTFFLILITAVVMAACVVVAVKYAKHSKLFFWAMCLVLFGGAGNMIDRIFNGGKVVDFLQFSFFPSFPVFNVADCAVCIGAGLLILYFVIDIIKDIKIKKAEDNGDS
jgi:signal peptidase II